MRTIAEWSAVIAALPAQGPLPCRTVLVASEREAHALRRELARAGKAAVLAGTRFLSPVAAAEAVVAAAGTPFTPGEDGLRAARLLALLREDLGLVYFGRELLERTRGWEIAIARAIGELEAAGLRPSDLPSSDPRARDLALLWTKLDALAGASVTRARLLAEAAALLRNDPRRWPWRGPVAALATGHETAVLSAFLRAVPGCTVALRASAPLREDHLARVAALFGAHAREALAAAPSPEDRGTERDLLARFLFAGPERLADPDRRRSAGPDGTVHLEEHSGVEEELEAAAAWVAREIEAGAPLEELAVLVPSLDPLAALVAARLERLTGPAGPVAVHVAGGLPAVSSAAGARALAVVRALADHLPASALAAVLPSLRCDAERGHLSHGEAMELAFSLGIAGGNAARPEGALEWARRAAEREEELRRALEGEHHDDDSAERERRGLERTLSNLCAVRPAVAALADVARALHEGRALPELWSALRAFLERWLLSPGEGPSIATRLDAALERYVAAQGAPAPGGQDALALIEAELLSLRDRRGRFGEPAIHVGTVEGAAGLPFRAVRVIGLSEGSIPPAGREDAVLAASLRDALGAAGARLRTPRDHVVEALHALHAVVLGAERIVLSAPRTDLSRTEREPSSVFIEAAAALGRPNAVTHAKADDVPNLEALRRDAFAPARRHADEARLERPVGDAAWLERIAAGRRELPPAWAASPVTSLARLQALESAPVDGELPAGAPFPRVPGLDPLRPISASAIQQLLACPRRFLLQRFLGWDEPAAAPSLREVDALTYGSLFHRVAERFYAQHGERFVAGRGSLAKWQELAAALAEETFAEWLRERPLIGVGPRKRELRRLHEDLRALLDYDHARAQAADGAFHGVEIPFGYPEPLALPLGDGRTLHVRGFIDRVDVEGGQTLVRDLKTGKAHRRQGKETDPSATRDVQLGLYALVAQGQAKRWGTPKKVAAAYVYPSGKGDPERAFREDSKELLAQTMEWLRIAASLLDARAFPPSLCPDEDCAFCCFAPLCDDEVPRRAADALAGRDGALGAWRDLKTPPEEQP